MHTTKEYCSYPSYITNPFFFCYSNCYCSRMPKAWESAHFIIQRLPLLNFCFLQSPLPLKAKDYFNAFLPTGRVEIQFPLRLWCTICCVSVCCSTEGLAQSAADQGGNFYDILLHGCPQSKGLEVLRKASLLLGISMRLYEHQSALSASIKYASLTGTSSGSKIIANHHL